MTIGQRLRRAIERAGLTQKEIAMRAGLEAATVSDILNDRTRPAFATVERMIGAIGTTYGELFDEPRVLLSVEDALVLQQAVAVLNRLLANDAAKQEKSIARPGDELLPLPNEPVPERHFRKGARRAFKVTTDAMIGAGILDGDVVYVRPAADVPAADGEVIACRLDGALYVKRLDLRGGHTVLVSENPRYPPVTVRENDNFLLIGVVTVGR